MHHHSLADTANIENPSPNRSLSESINPRRHRNRPPPTRHALNILNARANDTQYPAPHRFDFW
jgi:hypothetical protein